MKLLRRLLGLGKKKDETERTTFECDACGETFASKTVLQKHAEDAHTSTEEVEMDGGADDAVDYDALAKEHTIAELKEKVEEDDLDLKELLKAEKANKDRKTMKSWIEDRL